MLVRVFSSLANRGSIATLYWLQHIMPNNTVSRIQIIKDQAIVETKTKEQLKLTNGILYKKLKRGRAKFTIPLLVDICRMYDPGIRVDKALTNHLNSLLNSSFILLPFYTKTGKLTTTVPAKSFSKITIKGCKVVAKTKKEITIELNSSKRLQTMLIDIIRRQAL